jgi:hypothetical protein
MVATTSSIVHCFIGWWWNSPTQRPFFFVLLLFFLAQRFFSSRIRVVLVTMAVMSNKKKWRMEWCKHKTGRSKGWIIECELRRHVVAPPWSFLAVAELHFTLWRVQKFEMKLLSANSLPRQPVTLKR